jgi:threonine aldolase
MQTQFASDNYAPVHPRVLEAIKEANEDYAPAYGKDLWTENLDERIEEIFGWGSQAFPVLNGTGANVVSLMAATPRWGAAIATDIAHINVDENAAPERVGGLKLLTQKSGESGKLTIEDLEKWRHDVGDIHRAQPAVISLTHATEVGTVYHPEELRELCDAAHEFGFGVHMDGARLANAAAFLGTGFRDQVTEVGVDLLSLGAAKNGGMLGEAVVVLGSGDAATTVSAEVRRAAAAAIPYLRKSTMQLASKSRFISAQLLALLGDPARVAGVQVPLSQRLWLRNARHANEMAQRLRAGVLEVVGDGEAHRDHAVWTPAAAGEWERAALTHEYTGPIVRVTRETESNAVFATLPKDVAERLRAKAPFYDWAPGETEDRVEVRWMCSWCTTKAEVDEFKQNLAAAL